MYLISIPMDITMYNIVIHIFLMMRLFKIYCLSNSHIYNIVLLTTVTML